MSDYKTVVLTGLDRVGKATAARLLSKAIDPCQMMSSPDYQTWSGQIIRSTLYRKPFSLLPEGGSENRFFLDKQQDPLAFQSLMLCNALSMQARIRAGLEKHHWVMDRYLCGACSYAYGLVDGCPLDWLIDISRPLVQPDVVICLVGEAIPRPNEEPDENEKDRGFQLKVWKAYSALCELFPHWHIVNIDFHREGDALASVERIHRHLCGIVGEYGIETFPRDREMIARALPELDGQSGLIDTPVLEAMPWR